MKQYTAEQIRKKYAGKYIQIHKLYDYNKHIDLYEVIKVYKEIHEDTTRGEDVGTGEEYTR
jgi:hypothetical protein